MLAFAPLPSLLCFLSPTPPMHPDTLLILQLVSDWLGARHVVLDSVPSVLTCVLLAGHASVCPSD